jgi:hypothetical protein
MNRSISSPEAIVVPKASVTAWSQLAGTLAIGCLLVTLAGCGPRGPDVQMVEGTITLDGAPLADAYVTFIPLSADGLGAVGLTRTDGGYVLNAMEGKKYGQGTLQGEYAVMVRKMVDGPNGGEPVLVSPEQYASQERTPLRATVVKGQNRFDFALSSKGSGPKAAK